MKEKFDKLIKNKYITFFTVFCIIIITWKLQFDKNHTFSDSANLKPVAAFDIAPPAEEKTNLNEASENEINMSEVVSNDDNIKKEIKPQLIKEAYLSIESKDIKISKERVDNLVKKFNAFYQNEEYYNQYGSNSFNLKIRIPNTNFDEFIKYLENGNDKVDSKKINIKDVTKEYLDLALRLKNKRDYLIKYKELLAKAITIKEILLIQNNIRTLVEEIESVEGNLNYIKNQISYSTLDLNIYSDQTKNIKPQVSIIEKLFDALSTGWSSLINFTFWSISFWPLILIMIFVVIIYKKKKLK